MRTPLRNPILRAVSVNARQGLLAFGAGVLRAIWTLLADKSICSTPGVLQNTLGAGIGQLVPAAPLPRYNHLSLIVLITINNPIL